MTETTDKEKQEEEMQKKYLELQLIGKQIKQGQKQLEGLDEQLESIAGLISQLDELKETKPGDEMLSPIGEGIFIKGTLRENSHLIVNVGANVAVEKTIDETKELLREKLALGQKHRMQMIEELEGMIEQAKGSEKELSSMME